MLSTAAVWLFRICKDEVRRFADAGIHMFTFNMKLFEDETFALFDKMIQDLLEADSQALFFPRVFVDPPRAWLAEHQDETATDDQGKTEGRVSFASSAWNERMAPVFTAFIRHMEKKYAHRVAGYCVSALDPCGEWFWNPWKNCDYSPSGLEAFRKWAKIEYHGNIRKLNKSWKPAVPLTCFETISPPSAEERAQSDLMGFRSPDKRQHVIDFCRFLQDAVADKIIYFSKIARRETQGKKLIGALYGYTEDLAGLWDAGNVVGCGHLAMRNVLQSKEIDFLASPMDYYDRALGGSDRAHSASDSVLLHDKSMYLEIDTRTALAEYEPAYPDFKIQSLADTLEVLKRNFSFALCKSFRFWWTELTGREWYNNKRILNTLSQCQSIYREASNPRIKSVAEVAVIMDEQAPMFLAESSAALNSLLYYQSPELSKMGTPYDAYLFDDVNKMMRAYKLYIFLNAFNVPKSKIDALHEKFKKDAATVIWLYAPGIIDGKTVSLENMKAITGITINCVQKEIRVKVRVVNGAHLITRGLKKNYVFGGRACVPSSKGFLTQDPNPPLKPVFYVSDPEAKTLGTLDRLGDKAGFAVKRMEGWNSIYCATGAIPGALLRNICEYAGVHVYTHNDDIVCANEEWLSVFTRSKGNRIINLMRETTEVRDVFHNVAIPVKNKRLKMAVKKYHAYLYHLKKRDRHNKEVVV